MWKPFFFLLCAPTELGTCQRTLCMPAACPWVCANHVCAYSPRVPCFLRMVLRSTLRTAQYSSLLVKFLLMRHSLVFLIPTNACNVVQESRPLKCRLSRSCTRRPAIRFFRVHLGATARRGLSYSSSVRLLPQHI
jgi:hypothetical protein